MYYIIEVTRNQCSKHPPVTFLLYIILICWSSAYYNIASSEITTMHCSLNFDEIETEYFPLCFNSRWQPDENFTVYNKNVMLFLILSFLSLKRLEYVFVILLVKNKSIIVKLRLIVQLMGDATSLVCFTMFCEPFWYLYQSESTFTSI